MAIVPGEFCGFAWKGQTALAACPSGYECTLTSPMGTGVVEYGPVPSRVVAAGTWRYLPSYPATDPVHNKCRQLAHERANQPNIPFDPIGFSC